MTRSHLMDAFLGTTDWATARRAPLAGDASNRSYLRITLPGGGRAVVMDAPPERGEDTRPFVQIASHLTGLGLSAPKILAQDQTNGFLLIEDLGDALFDRVAAKDTGQEPLLYYAAWTALLQIAQGQIPDEIPPYGAVDMAEKARLVADWYDPDLNADAVQQAVFQALNRLDWSQMTLALRDFHAQNLLWLTDRAGPARVGLLDFQDAQPGHILYDLVSLLFDARRDVSDVTRTALLAQAKQDTQLADFDQAIATLLAQRSLRILGVFARLSKKDRKPAYVDLIHRVFGQLNTALAHPSLTDLSAVLSEIATPDDAYLARLRGQS